MTVFARSAILAMNRREREREREKERERERERERNGESIRALLR